MISIRPETTTDLDAVRRVIVDAFTECEFGHNGEAGIVDLLRDNCDDSLSLVAVEGNDIVGHILFSPVSIRTTDLQVNGMGLAPMAVAPNHQRTGVGTALVASGLNDLTEKGCPFVVVLGHPKYYPRFGFVRAAKFGISHGFMDIPQDVFFVNILDQNAAQSIANGAAHYRLEFGPQHEGCRAE